MLNERRTEPRTTVALPVSFADGGRGMTRDISGSGLFVEADCGRLEGAALDLEITFEAPAAGSMFVAQGAVLRREPDGGRPELAVQLFTTPMKPLA